MNNFCLTTYVFGKYQNYIPFYIYTVLKSYPEYHIKIFLKENLTKEVIKSLRLIKNNISQNFEIIEDFSVELNIGENIIKGGKDKLVRWLIKGEYFKDYKYLYIGDVDFLIFQEKPSLLEWHKLHCSELKLPFSNAKRKNSNRLSGLHFVKVNEYFSKTNKVINEIFFNNSLEILNKITRDEELLFKIVDNCFDIKILEKNIKRPHHGIHLGLYRFDLIRFHNHFYKVAQSDPFFLLPPIDYIKKQLNRYFTCSVFLKIVDIIQLQDIAMLAKKFHLNYKK